MQKNLKNVKTADPGSFLLFRPSQCAPPTYTCNNILFIVYILYTHTSSVKDKWHMMDRDAPKSWNKRCVRNYNPQKVKAAVE